MGQQVRIVRTNGVHVAIARQPYGSQFGYLLGRNRYADGVPYIPQKDPNTTSHARSPPSGYFISSSSRPGPISEFDFSTGQRVSHSDA